MHLSILMHLLIHSGRGIHAQTQCCAQVIYFSDSITKLNVCRDLTSSNVMFNAEVMFPNYDLHPHRFGISRDGRSHRYPIPRLGLPVRYYFIDYGLSSRFPATATSRLVTGDDGRDQDVPELSATVPYDPFPVDVFTIANMFRKELLDVS